MSGDNALRSVAVFGGGVTALAAAAAFARALPRSVVTLVTMPVDAAALADRMPTLWPSAMPVLDRLGIDDRAMIGVGCATPLLAWRFDGWSRDGRSWLTVHGAPISVPGPGAIHQRWLDAVRAGSSLRFHALFPGAVLAEAGATAVPDEIEYALNLDSVGFGDQLRAAARHAGVRAIEGMIEAVAHADDGSVRSVDLADGARVTADLFIDATGPGALLAREHDWIDWTDALPCDRMLAHTETGTSANKTGPMTDTYRATDIGFSASWSEPSGLVRAVAYNAATTDETRARRELSKGCEAATVMRCPPGRRKQAWIGNMLALGDACGQTGPLGRGGFTLALAHLDLALDLLPDRRMEPLLIAEYNRRAAARADRMCDFLAAFYWARARRRGAFWQMLERRDPPPGLAAILAQFAQRGSLVSRDEDSVDSDAWRAVLLGQGIRPRRRDPVAALANPLDTRATLEAAAASLESAVARLTTASPRSGRTAVGS